MPAKAKRAWEKGDKSKVKRYMLGGDTFLGAGTFGTTVGRTIAGKPMAVKYVTEDYDEEEAAIQMHAAKVSVNVAKIFAACRRGKPGKGMVLMEQLAGPRFEVETLPPDIVKEALFQLLEALSMLHHEGIYHIDLKADNILFDKDPKTHRD